MHHSFVCVSCVSYFFVTSYTNRVLRNKNHSIRNFNLMSSFGQTPGYLITANIISVVSTILIITIIIHHVIQMRNSSDDHVINIYVRVITYMILSTALIFCLYYTVGKLPLLKPGSCYAVMVAFTVLYFLNKTCVHFSYFIRLKIAYKNSVFQVHSYFLAVCWIWSTVYFILFLIVKIMGNSESYRWNPDLQLCDFIGTHRLIMILILTSYDFIISIISLVLFLRPMFRLKMYETEDEKMAIFKIGLLNSILIVSSIASYTTYVFTDTGIIIVCDNVINSFCVVLMFKIHDTMFKRICCCHLEEICCYLENKRIASIDSSQSHVLRESVNV